MKHSSISEVIDALKQGKPAIFPTDTVYGLGVAVNYAQGPEVLHELKQREAGKPVAWLVGGSIALEQYGLQVPDYARTLAREHWPGALTLVVRAASEVPQAFQGQNGTIGLRAPAGETVQQLIAQVGPLATTSANRAGEEPATTFAQVNEELFAQVPALEGDADVCEGIASTVVDCTGAEPRILRQGSIHITV